VVLQCVRPADNVLSLRTAGITSGSSEFSHQPFRQHPTGTVRLRWQQELQLPPPRPFASLSIDSRLEALQLARGAALALVPALLHCVSQVGFSVLQSQTPSFLGEGKLWASGDEVQRACSLQSPSLVHGSGMCATTTSKSNACTLPASLGRAAGCLGLLGLNLHCSASRQLQKQRRSAPVRNVAAVRLPAS